DVEGDGSLDILAYHQVTGIYHVLHNKNQGGHLETNDFELVQLVQRDISQIPPKFLDLDGDGFEDILRGPAQGSGDGVYFENQSRFLNGALFQGSFLSRTNTLTNAPVVITADINR